MYSRTPAHLLDTPDRIGLRAAVGTQMGNVPPAGNGVCLGFCGVTPSRVASAPAVNMLGIWNELPLAIHR